MPEGRMRGSAGLRDFSVDLKSNAAGACQKQPRQDRRHSRESRVDYQKPGDQRVAGARLGRRSL
ncbi:hypothetical protein EN766_41310, partial [Mesorhizobium sp. M2A.F.Ca.ET.046.02.1.1]